MERRKEGKEDREKGRKEMTETWRKDGKWKKI